MPARRYYIATIPVQHINGKIAPVSVKCSNSLDPDSEPKVSYFYGYRHFATPSVSRYGIRQKRRNLSVKPYSTAEEENRTIFTTSLHAVYEHQRIAGDWDLMLKDFAIQEDYATPIGFAVAMVRANSGEWLGRWVA